MGANISCLGFHYPSTGATCSCTVLAVQYSITELLRAGRVVYIAHHYLPTLHFLVSCNSVSSGMWSVLNIHIKQCVVQIASSVFSTERTRTTESNLIVLKAFRTLHIKLTTLIASRKTCRSGFQVERGRKKSRLLCGRMLVHEEWEVLDWMSLLI